MIQRATISKRDDIEQSGRLEAMGRLAAGVAHEINTPMQYIGDSLQYLASSYVRLAPLLTAMPQILDALNSHPSLSDDLKRLCSETDLARVGTAARNIPEAIEDSQTGVKAVTSIVQAMKQFAHPGADRRMGLDVNELVKTAVTISKNEYKRVAELVLEYGEGLPKVEGLGGRLSQAILNLVINSAQAIAEKVQGTEEKGEIRITTRSLNDWVEIVIADNGGGIPKDIEPRVFESFFTTKQPGVGTGQGLPSVHETVVEQHGGSVNLNNQPGVGVEFTIRLPVKSQL